MEKTPHLHLNTWVESDPVSLEQMNENFTLLDTEAQSADAQRSAHEQALAIAAYHEAHRALEQYHAGRLCDHTRNLLICDFSKSGQVAEMHQLNVVGNKPITPQAGYSGGTVAPLVDRYDYLNDNVRQIAAFTPSENGELQYITVPIFYSDSNGATIQFSLYDGSTQVGQDEVTIPYDAAIGMRNAVVSISCELYAGHTYTLRGSGAPNATNYVYGNLTVTATAHNYSSGWFTTNEFAVKSGGRLHLWAAHTGAEPQIAMKQNNGSFQTLTSSGSESGKAIGGADITRREYVVENVAAGTVQLKITLSQSGSSVEELCGIVL